MVVHGHVMPRSPAILGNVHLINAGGRFRRL